MTVLEYFDYEKQLLSDYEAVKTPCAKTAVYKTLMDTLDRHKEFVFNTISSFEDSLKQARHDVQSAQKGETPKYVKDLMAEFGFHELEEVPTPDFALLHGSAFVDGASQGGQPKKKRGRPRKAEGKTEGKAEDKAEAKPVKTRGRPRKAEQKK